MTVADVELRKERETDAIEYLTVMVRSQAGTGSGGQWIGYGEFQEPRTRQILLEMGRSQIEIAEMFSRARAQYEAARP